MVFRAGLVGIGQAAKRGNTRCTLSLSDGWRKKKNQAGYASDQESGQVRQVYIFERVQRIEILANCEEEAWYHLENESGEPDPRTVGFSIINVKRPLNESYLAADRFLAP